MYEAEFRHLLKHSTTSNSLNIFLPKLDGIKYLYKDNHYQSNKTLKSIKVL